MMMVGRWSLGVVSRGGVSSKLLLLTHSRNLTVSLASLYTLTASLTIMVKLLPLIGGRIYVSFTSFLVSLSSLLKLKIV